MVKGKHPNKGEEEEDKSESESESEGEVEVSLDLDEDGRLRFDGNMVFDFRVFLNSLKANFDIHNDCKAAFTARSAGKKSAYSSGDTFWVPASAEPANALEQLAKEIFRFHTRNVRNLNEEISGAEWWTLVLDPQDAEVGFHWDKDYAIESDCNINVFPHVSSEVGLGNTSLITVDKVASPIYTEPLAGKATNICISRPEQFKRIQTTTTNKDIWPSEGEKKEQDKGRKKTKGRRKKNRDVSSLLFISLFLWISYYIPLSEMRITFLVNVWVNHKPVNATRFSSSSLSPCRDVIFTPNEIQPVRWEHPKPPKAADEGEASTSKPTTPSKKRKTETSTQKTEIKTKTMEWTFKQHRKQTLQVPIPEWLSLYPFKEEHSIQLMYPQSQKPIVL